LVSVELGERGKGYLDGGFKRVEMPLGEFTCSFRGVLGVFLCFYFERRFGDGWTMFDSFQPWGRLTRSRPFNLRLLTS
jgi:hypothetical protein